jgi:hypothetical protein
MEETKPEIIIKTLWKIIFDLVTVNARQKERIEELEAAVWCAEFNYNNLQQRANRWRSEYD